MKNKERNMGLSDLLLVVVAGAFLIGSCTVFAPCGPKEDGSWMTCHWAGAAVSGIAAGLLAASVLHLLISDAGIKMGISIAMLPFAVLAMLLPGNLIDLCMMDTMRCRAFLRPAAIVFAILMICAAVYDGLVQRKRRNHAEKG